jgi:phosphoesterase RecJ-like protein
MNSLQEVVQYLREQDDFIVVGHENPDPDCLGSMLGLYFGLTGLGKTCRVVSADRVPSDLSWPGLDLVEHIPEGFEPGESCVIVVDCEPDRTGSISEGVKSAKRLVNIDHHQRGRGIGDIVYVEPSEAATCMIIYRLLLDLDVVFDQRIATALYGGILGDTGGFRHTNTNSEVLYIAGKLLEFGLNPALIAREIFSSQPLGFLRLLGVALSNLQTSQDGQLVWMTVSYEQFCDFGVDPKSSDHLVSFARMLDTSEIAIVFRETSPGEIRVGLRANHADVGSLARHIGGGGHKLASGATILGDLQEVSTKVVEIAEHFLTTGEVNERCS